MNIQAALIPHKHVRFCDSVIALAGFIRTLLAEPRTIDELWTIMAQDNSGWLSHPPFEYLVYAIDTLFALKQIEMIEGDGRIKLRRVG
jgi:hypothetical protein